jgi:hypothetical protein
VATQALESETYPSLELTSRAFGGGVGYRRQDRGHCVPDGGPGGKGAALT